MFSGIESLKEEIKTFLKIKKVNIPPEQSYISVTNNKIIYVKKENGRNNSYNYEFSKIFSESDDYSNIYEEVTNSCINDCINGNNYTFISYGESYSEKHNLLFSDSCSNNKGIFPRLCKNLINKKVNFYISLMFVYDNKLFDINDIIENNNYNTNNEKNKIYEYIEKIIDFGIEIKQNSDIIEAITKIKINNKTHFIIYLINIIIFLVF